MVSTVGVRGQGYLPLGCVVATQLHLLPVLQSEQTEGVPPRSLPGAEKPVPGSQAGQSHGLSLSYQPPSAEDCSCDGVVQTVRQLTGGEHQEDDEDWHEELGPT